MSLFIKSIFSGASIQDNGRPGLQKFGITAGGAVDKLALAQGRAILNERTNTAAIEFSASGGKFVVQSKSFFTSTGAQTKLKLNGIIKSQGQVFEANLGDEIEVGSVSRGFYSYLHVAGGFLTSLQLGSRSANIQTGLGTILENGNSLPYNSTLNMKDRKLFLNDYFNSNNIRIVTGPQTKLFSKKVSQRFLDAEFEISSVRNRMGVRLNFAGENFCSKNGLRILSDVIEVGDIQIDGEGRPTVLLNDRQPTGGYPRIFTVISADLHKVAQITVNKKFRFILVSLKEAIKALEEFSEQIGALRDKVGSFKRDPRDISNLLNYGLIGGVIRGDEYDKS